MNVNSPKFVELARQKKKERRGKHKARMEKKAKRRFEDFQSRLMYWIQYDEELTKRAEAAKG